MNVDLSKVHLSFISSRKSSCSDDDANIHISGHFLDARLPHPLTFPAGQVPFPSMDLISPSVPPPVGAASNAPLPPPPPTRNNEVPVPAASAKVNGDIFDVPPSSADDGSASSKKSADETKSRASNDDNPFSFKKFLNSAPDAVTRPKVIR